MSMNVYDTNYFDKGNTIKVAFTEYSLPHKKQKVHIIFHWYLISYWSGKSTKYQMANYWSYS